MLPDFIPRSSIGPLCGLTGNAILAMLCLVVSVVYHRYRPLRSLFFFYVFITFVFLGWFFWGLQRSPESVLAGYRILYASLALLPATWFWFFSGLFNEKPRPLTWVMTGAGILLAVSAVLGKGPLFFALPLEPDPITIDFWRPQSKLVKVLIQSFCLGACILYISLILSKPGRFRERRQVLIPVILGLLIWFLGGLNDSLLAAGVTLLTEERVLWFASIWLSIFMTIAIAIHFRSLEQAVRETKDVFERFVPPAYLRRIAGKGLGAIRLGEADQQWVTILCCDIRGFTAWSERLTPSQLVAFVNRLYGRITRVVDERQGVIDKFLGDAVLCIFEGGDSAERAVACGVDMLAVVESFNNDADRPAGQTVQISIGLHTGPVILGTIGTRDRMDSTVLGLAVNLAKRLEEVTRSLGVDMLITQQVAHRLPKQHGHRLRKLTEASLKGCSTSVGIIEVYDQNPPEVQHLKSRVAPLMEEGLELFRGGQVEAALSKLQVAQCIYPQDLPLQLLITSIRGGLDRGGSGDRAALLDFR
ncbi:MAG TPA: adenylate/guanylate cyclase domain-containing protein [Thermodesulfobacteriota bacterium]|nr:adenylate/guanylate cyclase domain-containing protein [Thermodesulfobacteriota bacterium]